MSAQITDAKVLKGKQLLEPLELKRTVKALECLLDIPTDDFSIEDWKEHYQSVRAWISKLQPLSDQFSQSRVDVINENVTASLNSNASLVERPRIKLANTKYTRLLATLHPDEVYSIQDLARRWVLDSEHLSIVCSRYVKSGVLEVSGPSGYRLSSVGYRALVEKGLYVRKVSSEDLATAASEETHDFDLSLAESLNVGVLPSDSGLPIAKNASIVRIEFLQRSVEKALCEYLENWHQNQNFSKHDRPFSRENSEDGRELLQLLFAGWTDKKIAEHWLPRMKSNQIKPLVLGVCGWTPDTVRELAQDRAYLHFSRSVYATLTTSLLQRAINGDVFDTQKLSAVLSNHLRGGSISEEAQASIGAAFGSFNTFITQFHETISASRTLFYQMFLKSPYRQYFEAHRTVEIVGERLQGYSLEAIGKKFDLTRERVRQLTSSVEAGDPLLKLFLNRPVIVPLKDSPNLRESFRRLVEDLERAPEKYFAKGQTSDPSPSCLPGEGDQDYLERIFAVAFASQHQVSDPVREVLSLCLESPRHFFTAIASSIMNRRLEEQIANFEIEISDELITEGLKKLSTKIIVPASTVRSFLEEVIRSPQIRLSSIATRVALRSYPSVQLYNFFQPFIRELGKKRAEFALIPLSASWYQGYRGSEIVQRFINLRYRQQSSLREVCNVLKWKSGLYAAQSAIVTDRLPALRQLSPRVHNHNRESDALGEE